MLFFWEFRNKITFFTDLPISHSNVTYDQIQRHEAEIPKNAVYFQSVQSGQDFTNESFHTFFCKSVKSLSLREIKDAFYAWLSLNHFLKVSTPTWMYLSSSLLQYTSLHIQSSVAPCHATMCYFSLSQF